ncbi:hypothetical protein N7481_007840 [Penicillium waksmanii]|uniref:uncharacterized protein n=1 Tax=Penicillium waksmanii TaxID=69791 RepID=UPI002548AC4F|nr:uncharacterized protein N7481_007840 [Penicillium waksmanii]KAJ5980542.1 hypothetical protein N7481_007840 [Penicillium waksmanii]
MQNPNSRPTTVLPLNPSVSPGESQPSSFWPVLNLSKARKFSSPPRWTSMKPADKHFRCTVCQRAFTRIDHLKRHHLRHSGQKPYSCVFCNETFARCDNLRDHYNDCAQRGDRQIPETGQRGRRRHACQSCTSMKLRCDGASPCGSCVKRGLDCNNERLIRADTLHDLDDPMTRPPAQNIEDGSSSFGSPSAKPEIFDQPSDRGSIKFLLNGGTDSFTEQFRLPPRDDRARENRSEFPQLFAGPDPSSLQFFQDTFLDFFNGPFGDNQKSLEDPYTARIDFSTPEQDPSLAMQSDPAAFEPEQPFAMALVQSILARAWTVPLDPKAQEEISSGLNFLLTTARIRKFLSLYFRYWQNNCSIFHVPSFDPETTSLPLLAAVTFMGAMYSTDPRETYIAKRVLDFAELFVFSSPVFSAETEVASVFSGQKTPEEDDNDWVKFQNFLAGLIITVVQYWAGSRASRNRAMENRFSEIVKIARRLDLVKCRHQLHEQLQEHLWIQTECRIRAISVISLLDCAFFFYQNYPCRLTHSEMECELPCEESVFQAEHPFSEPSFRFNRDITIYSAFQKLFEPVKQEGQSVDIYDMGLTVLDTFILIHVLFAFINTHMTLVGLLKRQSSVIQALQNTTHGDGNRSMIPEDSLLISIRTALNRWRYYWLAVRSQVSNDEWASMGFYKNGYNFWLVSQLLITNKDAVDVILQMEVHCEDKLEKLKVLLKDEQD